MSDQVEAIDQFFELIESDDFNKDRDGSAVIAAFTSRLTNIEDVEYICKKYGNNSNYCTHEAVIAVLDAADAANIIDLPAKIRFHQQALDSFVRRLDYNDNANRYANLARFSAEFMQAVTDALPRSLVNNQLQFADEVLHMGVSLQPEDQALANQALLTAILDCHQSAIETAIKIGGQVNVEYQLKNSNEENISSWLIVIAAQLDDMNSRSWGRNWVVELLLGHRADIDATDSEGNSARSIAQNNKYVKAAIGEWASVQIEQAVIQQNVADVRYYIEAGADIHRTVASEDQNSGVQILYLAVHYGCRNGDKGKEIVELLMRAGADEKNLDYYGATPLRKAYDSKLTEPEGAVTMHDFMLELRQELDGAAAVVQPVNKKLPAPSVKP
ncbi:MAG: hypothetical protein ACOYK8_00355 [Alphaproteobacteria bacterium]